MGRPQKDKTKKTHAVLLRLSDEELAKLELHQRPGESRQDVLRRILMCANPNSPNATLQTTTPLSKKSICGLARDEP